jgi:predicted nucleic acid-binding Zn ribbon protein
MTEQRSNELRAAGGSCGRCGNPVPPGRRTYCSEACADVVAHQKRLERFARAQPKLAKFRIYDYRGDRG